MRADYPSSYFQWNPTDSSNMSVAFKTDSTKTENGWVLEFQCVEDLLNLPSCSVSSTIFGDVHYVATEGVKYVAADAKNGLSEVVPEADCPKVCVFC